MSHDDATSDPLADPAPDDAELDVPPRLATTRWWILTVIALSILLRVFVPLIAAAR